MNLHKVKDGQLPSQHISNLQFPGVKKINKIKSF